MSKIDDDEVVALAATPGPYNVGALGMFTACVFDSGGVLVAECPSKVNNAANQLAYIATASPDRLLLYIAAVRAAEKARYIINSWMSDYPAPYKEAAASLKELTTAIERLEE